MAISLGLPQKIVQHPIYNLGIALPFVCTFYLLNSNENLTILGINLGKNLSIFLKVAIISFHYVMFVVFLIFFAALSTIDEISSYPFSFAKFFSWFLLIVCILSLIFQKSRPNIFYFFGILSTIHLILLYLVPNATNLSLFATLIGGSFFSILCFVTGIMWLSQHPIFIDIVANNFGFSKISKESVKIGAIMLITSGYVIFYAMFKTTEFLIGSNE